MTEFTAFKRASRDGKLLCFKQPGRFMNMQSGLLKAIRDSGLPLSWTDRPTETMCGRTQPSSRREAALEETPRPVWSIQITKSLENHASTGALAPAVLIKVSRQNLGQNTSSTKSGYIRQHFAQLFAQLFPLLPPSYIFLFSLSKTDLDFLVSGMLQKTAYSEKLTFHKYTAFQTSEDDNWKAADIPNLFFFVCLTFSGKCSSNAHVLFRSAHQL